MGVETARLILTLFFGCMAGAELQSEQSPATQSAVAVSSQTPKACLAGLVLAVESGNSAQVRRLLLAGGEAEQALVDWLADLAAATAEFRQVLAGRFSADQLGDIVHEAKAVLLGQEAIANATEQIDGGIAEVLVGSQSIRLVKTADGWRVPVRQLFGTDGDNETLEPTLKVMRPQIAAIRQTSRELKAGRYNTVQEAGQMLRKHILEGITPSAAPSATTVPPTSQPAK